jgi:hypothetical protein
MDDIARALLRPAGRPTPSNGTVHAHEIQQPDRRADELRDRLHELLTEANGTLVELRVATRRRELAELPTDWLTPQPAMSLVGSCCAGALRAVFLAAARVGLHRMGMLDGEVDLDPELRHL